MQTIFGWEIKRAGGAMTITHMAGKLTGIVSVKPVVVEGVLHIVALRDDDTKFSLQPDA